MNANETQARLTEKQQRPHWMRHFARPEGRVGGLIGHLMAWKNTPLNGAAVELLDIQPDDDVLEIGYGPGTAIALIAAKSRANIAGVDLSAKMQQQASRRNRPLVEAGRLQLHEASVDRMPFDDDRFDRVLAVNNLHLWPDRAAALAEIRRVLRPGGVALLAVRGAVDDPGNYTPPGLTPEAVDRMIEEIEAAGFEAAVAERVDAGRELVGLRFRKPRRDATRPASPPEDRPS